MYYYSIGRDLPQSLIRLCYCAPMHIYTHLCVDHVCILSTNFERDFAHKQNHTYICEGVSYNYQSLLVVSVIVKCSFIELATPSPTDCQKVRCVRKRVLLNSIGANLADIPEFLLK